MKTFIKEKSAIGDLETDFLTPLKSSFKDLEEALKFFLENGIKNPNSALAGASDFLHLLGTFCTGFMWAKMVASLLEKNDSSEAGKNFKYAKIITGKFYMENILPKTSYLAIKIKAGDKTIMSLEKDQF